MVPGRRLVDGGTGRRTAHRRRAALTGLEPIVAAGALAFLLGGTWDVAWHIEVGRDTFWSPPHLVLYAGIASILAACAYAFVGARRRRAGLPAPGMVIAALGAALSLASAPLDELWHRLYGVDVTILSPPHVLLIGGMAVASYGAMAGFALEANRRDPARLAALWRSTAGGWRARASETGLYLSAGVALGVALAAAGEYDFDVSRYPVVYHPILLAGPGALVLAAAARAGGRVGGATFAAAAYTGVRLLTALELAALVDVRAQIPLVLLAAPALDLALWKLTPRRGWRGPALAGAAFAAVLLAVQWPYTTAANRVVWSAAVLARAAIPALTAGAAGAALGWLLGAAIRPVIAPRLSAGGGGTSGGGPAARWNGWSGAGGIATLLALAGLIMVALVPAAAQAGAPPGVTRGGTGGREAVGWLELSPPVPIAGQPVALILTFDNPALVGRAPVLPFESPRAGDVANGVLRATSRPGTYHAEFTPREPGRRWISVFFPGPDEERTAASALFYVYRPHEAPAQAAPLRRVVVRPEPGPQAGLPHWLEPLTYLALNGALGAVALAIAAVLRRASRQQRQWAVEGVPRAESSRALARY